MEKSQAKNLINETFDNKFNKDNYGKFIINLLDGINVKEKQFTCGNALVPDAFKDHINSYGRLGQYKDPNNKEIEVLWVNLKKDTALDRARTMQRNFIAWYLNGGRGGVKRKNALVAFYNSDLEDWRFSFVKIDTDLQETKDGEIKIKDKFTAAKRFSFLVGEQEPNHTAQKRLLDVLQKERPTLADIEESFNIENVSKEFFATYKALFLELVDNLNEIKQNDSRIDFEFATRQVSEANFCKKLMGQLVFLYFIQKKGWLGVKRGEDWGNGDKKFLRNTFEKAVKEEKNFFNDYLEPLFYNALANGERDHEMFELLDCRIPFLNGGLFEPIGANGGYDWNNTDIIIKNEVFSNNKKTKDDDQGTGILDVFDRYNFTVKEDEPLEKEVAVDPEMLGRVFEELLEVQDRKSKGAFYTPREIVHYMCQESLINYLSTELEAKVPKEDIAEFIHHGDEAVQQEAIAKAKKEKIKSGELKSTSIECLLADSVRKFAEDIDKALANIKICDPAIGSGAFPVGMMNEIIRARLTLLEAGLVKQTKNTTAYEYKRQAIQNSIYGVDIDAGAIEIAKLRLWLSLVVDEDDMNNIKPLPNLDYKIVCGNSLLDLSGVLIPNNLKENFITLADQHFNETRKREKKRLKKEIDEILKGIFKMAESVGSKANFDFELYFYDVFKGKGGFDVVIGNPPYVKAANQEEKYVELRKMLNNSHSYKTLYEKWDLYVAFIERGVNCLKSHGLLSFIISNSYNTGKFAIKSKDFITNENQLIKIDCFRKSHVFENAAVESTILFVRNQKSENYSVDKTVHNGAFLLDSEYFNIPHTEMDKIYRIEGTMNFDKCFNYTEILGNICYLSVGMVLNADEKKYNGEFTKDDLISDTKTEINNRAYTEAKHFKKYRLDKIKYLEWGTERVPSKIRRTTFPELYLPPKIIRGRTTEAIYSTDNLLVNDSAIVIKLFKELSGVNNKSIENSIKKFNTKKRCDLENISKNYDLKYILSIINSTFTMFYLNTIRRHRIEYYFYPDDLKIMPIKSLSLFAQQPFINLVDKILDLTKLEDYRQNQENQAQVKEYEKEIDLMVYKLYELDYSEVLVIDPEFSMGEEEYCGYSLAVGEGV